MDPTYERYILDSLKILLPNRTLGLHYERGEFAHYGDDVVLLEWEGQNQFILSYTFGGSLKALFNITKVDIIHLMMKHFEDSPPYKENFSSTYFYFADDGIKRLMNDLQLDNPIKDILDYSL